MKKHLPFCLLGLLLCAGLLLTAFPQQMPPSTVSYTEAKEHPLKRSVQLPGTVEALKVSTVASEVAGLMVELNAREGTAVAKGQPLTRLRRENLKEDGPEYQTN